MDAGPKLATVVVGNIWPKWREPVVRMHTDRDGKPSKVVLEGLHEATTEPIKTVTLDAQGNPDTVTVKGICLERCTDEPGRMSEADIRHHVLHMAALAIRDEMEALKTTPEQAAKKLAEHEAQAAKYRALAAK